MDYSITEHLLRIRQEIGEIGQSQTDVAAQLTALDNRLSNIERCVINLRNDAVQASNRSIWSDDERTAYVNWLTDVSEQDEHFPSLPDIGG